MPKSAKEEEGRVSLRSIGDSASFRELERLARRQLKPLSPSQQRLIEAASPVNGADSLDTGRLLFQHATLCQTYFPYRDPGTDRREWTRKNGSSLLELVAGKYYDGDKFVPVGLPFGAKARLVLLYINQRAVRGQSPAVDVGDSLTSFVARILKLDTGGKTITAVKLQLLLLSACQIRFGWIGANGRPQTENPAGIMRGFEMWAPKEANERVRWPSEVRLSNEYWTTLKEQAVPLEEQHIRALSHSGMALDIYAWLAHRLHRVPEGKPALVAWPLLQDQFGAEIGRLRNFRQLFRIALTQVLTLYRDANIHDTPAGLILNKSPPIVKPRISIVVSSPIGSNS